MEFYLSFLAFLPNFLSREALIKALNNGWGAMGRDLNSGWN